MRRWRAAAVSLSALAAALLLVVGIRESTRPDQPQNFDAVLQKDAASPAFLLTVDIATKELTIRAVAPDQQPGKSYELWLVNPQLGNPRSLGLVETAGFSRPAALGAYERNVIEGATYAISLEPQGGSPTGQPTGPVLYAGKLVQATR
jgi:anti-sigma-K factor RskA